MSSFTLAAWRRASIRRYLGARPAAPASRLVHLYGLAMVAMLAVGLAALLARDRASMLEAQAERNRLVGRIMVEQVTRTLDNAALLLATLGGYVAEDGPSSDRLRPDALAPLLQLHPEVRGVAVLDAQGQVLASSAPEDLQLRVDPEAWGAWPGQGRERVGRWTPGRGLADLTRQEPGPRPPALGYLPLLRRAVHQDRPVLLVALVHPERLATMMQLTVGEARAMASLTTFDGTIVASTADRLRPGQAVGTHSIFTQRLARQDLQSYDGRGLDTADALVALRVSPTRALVVVVESDRGEVQRAWWEASRGTVALAVLVAATLLAFALVAARSVRARERARQRLDRAQAALLRRERALTTLFDTLPHLVFRCRPDGTLTFVNPRATEVLGATAGQLRGTRLQALVMPEDRPLLEQLLQADDLRSARPLQIRLRGEFPRRLEFSVMPHVVDGQLVDFAGGAVDVTDRERAARQLADELAFNAQLMDLSPLPMSLQDDAGRYVAVNRAWEALTGRARGDVLGRPVGAHLASQEAEAHAAQDRQLRETGAPLRYAMTYRSPGGPKRDLVVNKVLVQGREGNPCILATVLDVTDLRDSQRDLAEARDRAEQALRFKTEFIANVSHELRSPLQSIVGFAELGLAEPAEAAGAVPEILSAGRRMLALVNDLLDVARIESPVGTIHLERCDLRVLTQEVVAEIAAQARARQVVLDAQLPAASIIARADPLRIQQVLRNLLANAVRFSPAGGRVVIDASGSLDSGVSVRVSDRGPGIPPQDLERIFQPFAQSSALASGQAGTGLGLTISRKIVDAHGGTLRAENLAEGGCRFTLTLPPRTPGLTQPAPLAA